MPPSFFEGPEKKVELAVVRGHEPLRAFGRDHWCSVVEASGATVLSEVGNERFDAYLLSESSLFVFDDFLTMITCGRTSLVDSVAKMLERIRVEDVAVLVYERKNEHFPHRQPTSFFEDARRLREMIPGRAIQLGLEHEHSVCVFHTTRDNHPEEDDTTLEVLMHGLDPELAAAFHRPDTASGTVASALGLDALFEGYTIDEHVFEPSGYSLNAIRGGTYMSLHVTPERFGSYVSFETNLAFRGPSALVTRVVERFRPESFDVVAFVPHPEPLRLDVPGYTLRKHVQEPISGYHVTFLHFFRPPSGPVAAAPVDLD